MALPQQKFREMVFQMLYSQDLAKASEENLLPLLMKELSITKKSALEARARVHEIVKRLPEIDQLIEQTTISFRFGHLQAVERNILRVGIYELLFDASIPEKVAIAEAIRLTRKFGSPEAASFMNALLDALYKTHKGEDVNQEKLSASFETFQKNEEASLEFLQNMPGPESSSSFEPDS